MVDNGELKLIYDSFFNGDGLVGIQETHTFISIGEKSKMFIIKGLIKVENIKEYENDFNLYKTRVGTIWSKSWIRFISTIYPHIYNYLVINALHTLK